MNYIFFDIDGTLHKEDIFFDFIQFSLKKEWLIQSFFYHS